jgi:hypothetical protein
MPYKNIEDRKLHDKEYYRRNRLRKLAYEREYEHSEKRRQSKKIWLEKNKDIINMKHRIWRHNIQLKFRKKVISALGNKCMICGNSDFRVLIIHHIHGGGNAEREKLGVDYRYYKDALNHLEDFQLLCANCHTILHVEELWKKNRESTIGE